MLYTRFPYETRIVAITAHAPDVNGFPVGRIQVGREFYAWHDGNVMIRTDDSGHVQKSGPRPLIEPDLREALGYSASNLLTLWRAEQSHRGVFNSLIFPPGQWPMLHVTYDSDAKPATAAPVKD